MTIAENTVTALTLPYIIMTPVSWSREIIMRNYLREFVYRLRGEYTTEKLVSMGMKVGKNFKRLNGVILDPSHCWLIEIGDNVTMAPRVHILCHDASTKTFLNYTKIGRVSIGDNVFIGAESIVLPGVTIGSNVVIGAGSVVTHDVPGGMLVDGGFAELAACAASSHFSAAERQFRYPLEMGVQAVPSSQRTVTGAGSIIIQAAGEFRPGAGNVFEHVALTGGTIGSVEDFGITDANNMGAAMAPAAFKTIKTHLSDYSRRVEDYDRIITGDLGIFGSDMLYELLRGEGIEIADRHEDCGKLMFSPEQNVNCGASGCGCAATVMSSWFLPKIESGEIRRVLFLATGALMSPVSSLQGESIPSIAHAVVIEHID